MGSSMTTIFCASCWSCSSDAKKNANASALRSPALSVLRNEGPTSAVWGTAALLINTLYEQAEPPRVLTESTWSRRNPALKRPR